MKNVCKRNCTWNHDGRCCPECNDHYEDGTAHTKNCSEYLNDKHEKTMINNMIECELMIGKMNASKVRRARYELSKIIKPYKKCGNCVLYKNGCSFWEVEFNSSYHPACADYIEKDKFDKKLDEVERRTGIGK